VFQEPKRFDSARIWDILIDQNRGWGLDETVSRNVSRNAFRYFAKKEGSLEPHSKEIIPDPDPRDPECY
jgi:hypothetical protein